MNSFEQGFPVPVPKRNEVVACGKCKNEFFEQFRVNQYSATHTGIIGQAVPTAGGQDFVILRCVKCLELYQPNVIRNSQDISTKLYDRMLDLLEAPLPK